MLIGVIAGLIGLSFGMFGVLAFRVSEQQRHIVDVDVDDPSLPEGAAEVLAVLGRAFVVVDAIDGVVRASPAAYAYGLVRGHTVVHQQLLEMTAKVRRDGVILEKQLELPRGPLGQGTIVVQVRAAVITEEYILLLADDRTEFTRTEEVRNDFVANVSHELKTPVGAISLLAEALESSADDPEAVKRFAKRMHKESTRLAALVQDIIELSRLQGANVAQQGRPVDINTVVSEAVDRSAAAGREQEHPAGGRRARRCHGLRRPGPPRHRPAQPDRQRHPLLAGEHQGGRGHPGQGRPRGGLGDGPGRWAQRRGPGACLRALLPGGCCPLAADRRHGAWPEHRQARHFQPRRRGDPVVPARPGFHVHHSTSRDGRAGRRRRPRGGQAAPPSTSSRDPRPQRRDAAGVHEQGATA